MNKTVLFKKLLSCAVIFLGVAYGLWPADVIPDIPLAGWIDDAGVIGVAFFIVIKLLPREKPPLNQK